MMVLRAANGRCGASSDRRSRQAGSFQSTARSCKRRHRTEHVHRSYGALDSWATNVRTERA